MMKLLHACSWRMTVSTLICVLRAVATVHSLGITHGDLAPRNVFVSDAGRPVLGDFDLGVVRVCIWCCNITLSGDVMTLLEFMCGVQDR
jgi:tRNA A-37 threonylcarbamoyl transferase component Bud32